MTKGRVNKFVTYLSVEADPTAYIYNQFVKKLFYEQDIEEYKDDVYYSTTPPVEVGDNYFEETLEGLRIEWSDSQLKAF